MWLKEGDANTAFFHRSIILRRRKNFIGRLLTDQSQVLQHDRPIKQHIVIHFRDRWVSCQLEDDIQLPQFAHSISNHQNEFHVQSPSDEKIVKAVYDIHPDKDKAPGLDGFQSLFFKEF